MIVVPPSIVTPRSSSPSRQPHAARETLIQQGRRVLPHVSPHTGPSLKFLCDVLLCKNGKEKKKRRIKNSVTWFRHVPGSALLIYPPPAEEDGAVILGREASLVAVMWMNNKNDWLFVDTQFPYLITPEPEGIFFCLFVCLGVFFCLFFFLPQLGFRRNHITVKVSPFAV